MKRKSVIIDQVYDVEGHLWDVREIRESRHGFDLLFGSPDSHLGVYRGGLPRLIATQSLIEFWDANRTKHDGILFDLPAGRSTLKRIRRRFGFNYLDNLSEFWKERLDDLETLSAREFARRHNVNVQVVFDTRPKILGRRARQIGWWRTPERLEILRSKLSLREVGEHLSISISQAHRLRRQALHETVLV
ncbi:MAG: hypothetical protein JO323_21555 [Acidobacteriia bacterium]|nr:hypothetical protein [Terriglobia bacterium]